MKHRTFLTTLFLFLVTINLGIALIAIHSYRETLEQARSRSASEYYFIASGLLKDISALDNRDADYKQGITQLVLPYGYLAGNQNAGIALYDGEELLYSNIREERLESHNILPENTERRILITGQGAGSAVLVTGRLPDPYSSYALLYRSSIADIVSGWKNMKDSMFGVGLILSGVLALCLLFLLSRLFRPLTDISKISRRIAGGEYSTRLMVAGKDELAEMAANFNHMADEIERQIGELVATAQNKQLFVDNFAHELKTPLTAIYGYAEYLQKASIPEEERGFAVECIMSESRRMQTMAHQMMELANLRSDEIQLEPLSSSDLLHKVKQAIQPKASAKEIDLLFFCEIETLFGDADLLKSLLINLIDNAIKASEAGSQVTVRVFKDNGTSMITVEDHGKGMPKEALSHVTEPYYRIEKHRHSGDGGAGLGLAICEQIALRHKARLLFVSSPGIGTTAKFSFTTL